MEHAYLVMKRMSHSSTTVTYDRYAKLFPERDAVSFAITGLEAGRNRSLAAPPVVGAEVVALR